MTFIKTETLRLGALLYPIPEVQDILGGISRTTVYELAKRRDIDIVKIGARSFVTHESLQTYVASLVTSDK